MSQPLFALFIRGPESDIFDKAQALGFEDDSEALAISLFEDGPNTQQVQALYETEAAAKADAARLNLSPPLEYFIVQLPDEDWVAKSQQGLPPVRAGRFIVYGAHDKDNLPPGAAYPILVEAGPAFGTGHHGTTRGCLMLFDDMLSSGAEPSRVLDLGCGAGTLAIAAAMALGRPVLATDIDAEAVDVTNVNAAQNGVSDLVIAATADGLSSRLFEGETFDLIFANILAGPLMEMAPDISAALAPGGRVILSGILDEQAPAAARAFEDAGLRVQTGPSLSGWTSLLGEKP